MKVINLLVIVCLIASCHNKRAPLITGKEGKAIPSFSLLLPDSTTYYNVNGIDPKKTFVLFYFSPQCPYCRAMIREITSNVNDFRNIQIYIFTNAPFNEMKTVYKQYDLNKYSGIMMGYDYANFFKNYFNVEGVPFIAVYGKNHRLNAVYLGRIYADQIIEASNM